jgi:hypothetical protein
MMRSGTSCSFSNPSAQMPMMKPNSENDTQVSTRKSTMMKGCSMRSGTNSAAVARMIAPRISDFVAAAPT